MKTVQSGLLSIKPTASGLYLMVSRLARPIPYLSLVQTGPDTSPIETHARTPSTVTPPASIVSFWNEAIDDSTRNLAGFARA